MSGQRGLRSRIRVRYETSRWCLPGSRTRGQSEVLSVVLLVVLALAGTALIISAGTGAVNDSREQANLERVENAMTSFDARAAKVALGRAPVQSINLGDTDEGHFSVEEADGWIRVVHDNYTAAGDDTETVYNETLGAVVYRNGDTAIAYQGGGVWRHGGDGSVVVSPPEFHYRHQTLTLPLVLTRGTGATAGSTKATVSADGPSTQIYPTDKTYGDGETVYRNPVQNGSVEVTVKSTYYRAWATFFRTQTRGTVIVDDGNETVTLVLTAGGTSGDFEMPREGSAIDVTGLAPEHAIENFTITLAPDDSDAAEFDNLQWTLYVDSGAYQLEYHLRKSGEIGGVDRCRSNEFSLTVYFSDQNGNLYHGWHEETAFTSSCVDRDGDGLVDETQLHANFTGPTQLQMADLKSNDVIHFNPSGATRATNYTFDEHAGGVDWEPQTYSEAGDDDASITKLTNHYFSRLGPNFDLVVDDKESDTVNEDASYGTLEYDAEGKVTYMHITENRISVRLAPA